MDMEQGFTMGGGRVVRLLYVMLVFSADRYEGMNVN